MIKPHELFALLSDETRLRTLSLLRKEGELCVCELGHIVGGLQPKISRHLALLRRSGLVLGERRGQWVYYRLNEKVEGWVQEILEAVLKPLSQMKPYQADLKGIAAHRKKCC